MSIWQRELVILREEHGGDLLSEFEAQIVELRVFAGHEQHEVCFLAAEPNLGFALAENLEVRLGQCAVAPTDRRRPRIDLCLREAANRVGVPYTQACNVSNPQILCRYSVDSPQILCRQPTDTL